MRILIVDTFYGPYLERLYSQKNLLRRPWEDQHRAHFEGGFGTGNAYSSGLKQLGVEAIEIVANSIPLQRAWAKEHCPKLLQLQNEGQQLFAILEAQINWFEATVLYVQDINWLPAAFIRHVKPLVEMVVGQNACPLATNLDLSTYDLLLTSLPHYVEKFRSTGVKAAYFPIGFDERLLQRHSKIGSRTHPLTFVGGLGGYHSKGTQMLETIASELPLRVWGYGGKQLPENSHLKQQWRGEAWAEDMYNLLAKSQITINRHIDIAEDYANNMRLFEATGMGACLVTDAKLNLACMFEPDLEVVTYASPAEAVSKIKELIRKPEAAAAIAERGQARTLKQHTYSQRMRELIEILKQQKPKSKTNNFDTPKPQKILVVCRAENIKYIPEPLRQALQNDHRHHKLFLISDIELQQEGLQKIPRWCISAKGKDEKEFQSILNAIEPDQILITEDQAYLQIKIDWIEKMKKTRTSTKHTVLTCENRKQVIRRTKCIDNRLPISGNLESSKIMHRIAYQAVHNVLLWQESD